MRRRAAAGALGVVVLVALAWWGLSAVRSSDGSDGEAGPLASGSVTSGSVTTSSMTSTSTVIDDVDALGEAIGCDALEVDEYSVVPPAADPTPRTPSAPHRCLVDGGAVALLHLTDDAVARDRLVAYLQEWSRSASDRVAHPNGCPGEDPSQTEARLRLHVVVGERWVATTRDADRAAQIAAAAGGEPAPFGPALVPPASYQVPPDWDCDAPPAEG